MSAGHQAGGTRQAGGARPAATGIVLAGGRSVRFGRDKLAEVVDGRPLLERAVAAVASVSTEVLVVVAPGSASTGRRGSLGAHPALRIVEDARGGEGPLEGLRAGLAEARESLVLVVGGDMPGLVPAVLDALLDALVRDPHRDAAALRHAGRRQQLPMAVRTEPAASLVEALIDAGERRLGVVLERLAVVDLTADAWLSLDPEAATLRDVDVPDDLGPS